MIVLNYDYCLIMMYYLFRSHEMLTPLLANGFPYMIKNEHHQACYFLNLLFITQYIPDFRKAILEILIDKMIRIDVSYCRILCRQK